MSTYPTLGDLRMAHDPAGRGYHAVYREQEVNHCPGCGRTTSTTFQVLAEDIPDDWECPECGVGKDDFVMAPL